MKSKKSGVKSTLTITLISVIVALLALQSCTKKQELETSQVLKYPLVDDVKTLDPANAYDSVSLDVLPSVVETLYQYDYNSKEYAVVPLQAETMPEISKDKLTYTIHIKKGMQYADHACFKTNAGKGREIKAADFIYGFKRLAHPGVQSQGAWIFEGRIVGFTEFSKKIASLKGEELKKAFNENSIEGFKIIDDYTFEMKLIKPYPQLMYLMTMTFTSAVPQEAAEACQDEKGQLNDTPIGSGPYKLEKLARNQEIILTKSPSFREKEKINIEKIVFKIIKEEQPAWLNFLKGDLDINIIPKDNYSQAVAGKDVSPDLKAKGIKLDISPGGVFYWLEFNVKDKVLTNKYLRQAMSSAVNREQWIELFTNNRGKKQVVSAPEGLADRPTNTAMKFDYNIVHAKELLKKAGFPEGKGLGVINLDMRRADSTARQMGEFFTKQFAEIGIKLNVIYNTFPAFLEKQKQGATQLSYGGWQLDYPDLENVYMMFYGPNKSPGANSAMFDNPAFNKLFEQFAVMQPGKDRAAVAQKMEDIIQEETPWIFGYYRDEYNLYHEWVNNYHYVGFIKDPYKYYSLDLAKRNAKKQ